MSVLLSLLSRRNEYGVQEFHTSKGIFSEALPEMDVHFLRLLIWTTKAIGDVSGP